MQGAEKLLVLLKKTLVVEASNTYQTFQTYFFLTEDEEMSGTLAKNAPVRFSVPRFVEWQDCLSSVYRYIHYFSSNWGIFLCHPYRN